MSKQEEETKVKVLHIMSGFGGGISSFILNKARALAHGPIQFDVVTYDQCSPEFTQAIQSTGGQVAQLVNPKKVGWSAFKASFNQLINQNHYDYIHCHIAGYRALPYYYLARKAKQGPFLIHAHLTSDPFETNKIRLARQALNQAITRRLSAIIIGCGQLAIQGTYGPQVSHDEMLVIPNSIEVSQFSQTQEQKKALRSQALADLSLTDFEGLWVGQMARLKPIKNHQFTLKLAAYLRERGVPVRFILAGQGPLAETLQSQIDQLGLTDSVYLVGRLRPEVFFAMTDVMLLPSFFEGLPTVVVESQAAGVPTLMSDTISQEVDLGLGLVQSLSLDDELVAWAHVLQSLSQRKIPSLEQRQAVIEAKKFTNQESADLYADFLFGRVSHYQIR
ncbi:glycosyltransferase [Vaginisenegalia massiliensis]|uniref:glycosyltransferase n=1 Tax=Vaginisenegalia massiliensis TaxID=2058294 RepID=UPI000F531B4C|nr:glycosyltransferase [Vaginisenegalia massiliensis]